MSPTGYAAAANIRHVSRSCVFARALTLCTTSSRLSGFTPAPSRRDRACVCRPRGLVLRVVRTTTTSFCL